MADECYFCHRTEEECREYIDRFIDDNKEFFLRDERIPADLDAEGKRAWVHDEYNSSKYGFTTVNVERFSSGKGSDGLWFKVPVCSICRLRPTRFEEELMFNLDGRMAEIKRD